MKTKTELIWGDCLIENDNIEDGSVDLILTDLPYGTIRNAPSTWDKSKTEWDTVIDTDKIMQIANRILRKNGKMVLFCQEPFTTELRNKAIPNIPFSYRAVWEKDSFGNHLGAKVNMVSFTEDILVFSKNNEKHDTEGAHPLRSYFLNELDRSELSKKEITTVLGNGMASHYFTNGIQFCIPTEKNYKKLQSTGFFDRPYEELKAIDIEFKEKLNTDLNEKYPSTFNLWEGNKYKSNILKYSKDKTGHHPTQKPVLLLEDLIKTYSNNGDLVVDLTMGSGSTGVAAANTGRRFVGIEMDINYFEIAKERISKANEAAKGEQEQGE